MKKIFSLLTGVIMFVALFFVADSLARRDVSAKVSTKTSQSAVKTQKTGKFMPAINPVSPTRTTQFSLFSPSFSEYKPPAIKTRRKFDFAPQMVDRNNFKPPLSIYQAKLNYPDIEGPNLSNSTNLPAFVRKI